MEEKSEAEKIKLALEILESGQLDEAMDRIRGLDVNLATYKEFAELLEKFLGMLDRTEKVRHDEFFETRKEYELEKQTLLRQDTLGVYAASLARQDKLMQIYERQASDYIRWRVAARRGLKMYFGKLMDTYKQVDWNVEEKQKQLAKWETIMKTMAQEAKELGVDLDFVKTFEKLEEKAKSIEIKSEIKIAEINEDKVRLKEIEVVEVAKKYFRENNEWPLVTNFLKAIGGSHYDAKKAWNRLCKKGELERRHEGKNRIRIVVKEPHTSKSVVAEAPNIVKTRDFSKTTAETDDKVEEQPSETDDKREASE